MYYLAVLIAFGFVIFWHELGHFLAARWAGVRVEQFAVGMGQALISFRKGIGLRTIGFNKKGFHWGDSRAEYEARTDAFYKDSNITPAGPEGKLSEYQRGEAAKKLGIGETEYRLSWIPLGGYVKPTGQDDLRPAKEVGHDDPYAYGAKPVGKRMVIISAGVIMNVILAFVLYVVLFRGVGFRVPPAVAGGVVPGSPAQLAGIRAGDTVLEIDGQPQNDYLKLRMNVALQGVHDSAKYTIQHADGTKEIVSLTPVASPATDNLPAIGVMQSQLLQAPRKLVDDEKVGVEHPDTMLLAEGSKTTDSDRITKVNNIAVGVNDYHILHDAMKSSGGKPVTIEITSAAGVKREAAITPHLLLTRFEDSPFNIAGLQPRLSVQGVSADATEATRAGIHPDDVITGVNVEGNPITHSPTFEDFKKLMSLAGEANKTVTIQLQRGDQIVNLTTKTIPVATSLFGMKVKQFGLGINILREDQRASTTTPMPNSAGEKAGIAAGDTITAIDDQSVGSWFDVLKVVAAKSAGTANVALRKRDGSAATVKLDLSSDDIAQAKQVEYYSLLNLDERKIVRETSSLSTSLQWGVEETKYSIFQVYSTIRRLVDRSVPLSSLSGPVGIFKAGSAAANKGPDWLIWFTALISANLAVVNFLPIPVVDGGLFIFLLIEKLTGKPPSPKVQSIAQMIGIALLGSLFLFATYHDIFSRG